MGPKSNMCKFFIPNWDPRTQQWQMQEEYAALNAALYVTGEGNQGI